MSGTDYALTTNYGLYKPLPNADLNAWGSHLNLNADTIDSTLHTLQIAGPFLPLAGGSVTGPTSFAQLSVVGSAGGLPAQLQLGNINVGGNPLNQAFTQNLNFNGSNSAANIVGANNWVVNSDLLTKTGQLLAHTTYNYNFGGAGYSGSRGVIVSSLTQTGAISGGGVAQGIQSSVVLAHSWGGTNTYSNPQGGACALNGYTAFQSGYINGGGGSACELDVEAHAGSTFGVLDGLLITHTSAHAASGSGGSDAAIALSDQAGAVAANGWDVGLGFGGFVWPMKSSATLVNVYPSTTGGYPANARHGIDLSAAIFSGYPFRGPSGFSVDANANVQVGTGYLSPVSAGLAIDVSGSIATAVALVSGGSSWPTSGGVYYAADGNGGIYSLTLAGGAVTAVAFYNGQAPIAKGAPPANPVALTPLPGAAAWGATGLTVNLTWAARSTLSLNPTGKQVLTNLSAAATDAAAATAGVPIGGLYNNAGVVHVRLT